MNGGTEGEGTRGAGSGAEPDREGDAGRHEVRAMRSRPGSGREPVGSGAVVTRADGGAFDRGGLMRWLRRRGLSGLGPGQRV